MTPATVPPKEWLLPSEAARALGIAPQTFKKVASGLGIRCREIPGRVGKLYNRADVVRARTRMEEREARQVEAAPGEPPLPGRIGRPPKSQERCAENGTARTR